MKTKLPRKAYRWQPEIATSLIYWSLTFTILFTALIVQLELIKLNPYSLILAGIFAFFVWLGLQRKIWLKDDVLVIRALKKKNSRKIPLSSITELSVGTNGLTIEQDLVQETLIMRTKSKMALIRDLEKQPLFTGKIRGL